MYMIVCFDVAPLPQLGTWAFRHDRASRDVVCMMTTLVSQQPRGYSERGSSMTW